MTSPASCEVFLQNLLIKPLKLESRYHGFVSQPSNPKDECKRIEDFLAKNGPADICILGLGLNGHLGFNEPAPALQPHPHVAQLSAESLSHSMLALEPIKPSFGLTLGIGNILASRDVLLLVSGASKRAALKRTLEPSISTNFPASFLWLHQNAHVFCDTAAMGS
jgi:galactosamine-6-phosphate isomerase